MADSPGINTGKVVTFTVYSSGKKVSDSLLFKSIQVEHEVNRIGTAVLQIMAGDMPNADIPESASENFKPGQKIKVELGYESTNSLVFEGIVVSHKIVIPDNAASSPLLIVECKDEAIKATVARKNQVYLKKKDSEAISAALASAGLSVTVDDTKLKHTQLVQYYCTNWDFALSRADACGLLVTTNGNTVTLKAPKVSESPVLKVMYGSDLLAFDGELLAEDQFAKVKSVGWDPSSQKIVVADASTPSLNKQGNLLPKDMANGAGTDTVTLQTDAQSASGVLKAWADTALLKSGLARFRGTFSFRGSAKAVPGCIIELGGMGARFNGNVFVGSVTHTVKAGVWKTEVGMGVSPLDITHQPDVVAPAASGLLPGIEGLHIGVVSKLTEDPDSGCRIQVKIPLLNVEPNTIWARLAQFAAAKGTGSYFIPSVGDEVVLGFLNNDPNQAIILGSLYSSKYTPPYEADEKNYKRAIISPQKLMLELDDEKKIITLTTPGKNVLTISDDAKGITLKDQNDNELVMNDSGIKLTSTKDITLKAKGNISLDATGKVDIKAKQDATLKGMNVTATAQTSLKVSGSASAEISASGQTTVKGGMVMIN